MIQCTKNLNPGRFESGTYNIELNKFHSVLSRQGFVQQQLVFHSNTAVSEIYRNRKLVSTCQYLHKCYITIISVYL